MLGLIDWTISFGNLLQIAAILGGGLTMFFTMRADIRVLRNDVQYIEERMNTLNEAFTQLGKILTQVAVQDNRLGMIEKSVDEIRHGKGFISSKG